MLQIEGLKDGKLDSTFLSNLLLEKKKAVIAEMTSSWWETHHGAISSRQV